MSEEKKVWKWKCMKLTLCLWAFLFASLWGSMFVSLERMKGKMISAMWVLMLLRPRTIQFWASASQASTIMRRCSRESWPLGTWSRVFFGEDRTKEDWKFCSKKLRFTDIYIMIITSYSFFVYPCLSCRSCNSLHLTEIATRRVKHDFSDISQDPNTDFAWEQRREHGRRLVGRFWTLRQRGKPWAAPCYNSSASEFLGFDFCFRNEHPNPFKLIAW